MTLLVISAILSPMPLSLTHIELKEANDFVAKFHRHHKPVVGHRFSLGAMEGDLLVGVAICGRPVARHLDYRQIVEVTRLCTDGTRNACSFLYGACAKAAQALGFSSIQTYILEDEPGTSLRAVGWEMLRTTSGGDWNSSWRKGRRTDQPQTKKTCWGRTFSPR